MGPKLGARNSVEARRQMDFSSSSSKIHAKIKILPHREQPVCFIKTKRLIQFGEKKKVTCVHKARAYFMLKQVAHIVTTNCDGRISEVQDSAQSSQNVIKCFSRTFYLPIREVLGSNLDSRKDDGDLLRIPTATPDSVSDLATIACMKLTE